MAKHYKARPYQDFAMQKIIELPSVALMLDMGLGKTVVALTAMQALKYDYFDIEKILVVAPLKVAEATWESECMEWEHLRGFRCSKVLGNESQRLQALHQQADFYIINFENLVWLVGLYGNKWPFDMVVLDESSGFKNPSSKRFKAMRRVRPYISRLVELTGTPAPNGLMDIWSQVYLLDGGKRLGHSITEYRHRFFTPGARCGQVVYNWELNTGSDKEIYKRIADICISMKASDYVSLPDIVYNKVRVELTAMQMKKYRELEKQYTTELSGEELTATSAASVSNKLSQMANGAVYDEQYNVLQLHDGKIQALKEIIEANAGKPILVFYWFKHDLEKLKSYFKKAVCLKGAEDIESWNKGKVEMLLAHPASAGYGLNLQHGGHIVVWYGLTWSLELYQQANKRLHRSGQNHAVIINHLVAEGTIDEDIIAALERKSIGQSSMLEAIKARIRRYNEAAESE